MNKNLPVKILIVYTTAGIGHRRAAQALKASFEKTTPEVRAYAVDALNYSNVVFRKMYNRIYLELIQELPDLLGYIYKKYDEEDTASSTAKIRLLFDKLNTINLKKLIEEYDPHVIVCTHFLALEIFSDMKKRKKLGLPLYGVLTDYYPHAFWVYEHVDKYYVANEESQRNLLRRGIPEGKTLVTGIPIDPTYAELSAKVVSKERLGLDKSKPVVLLLNGGFGVGKMEEVVKSFQTGEFPMELLVVAGKNERLLKKLKGMVKTMRPRTQVFGFVENIHELMNASDLVITKPGGLSTSEAMASGLPMVLVDPIPGQEDRNCEYLLEKGVAVRLYDLSDAANKVLSLLEAREKFEVMKEKARKTAEVHAAQKIAEDVLSRVASSYPISLHSENVRLYG